MRERALVLRSNLVVRSKPGDGTTISVTTPLRAEHVQLAPATRRPRPAVSR